MSASTLSNDSASRWRTAPDEMVNAGAEAGKGTRLASSARWRDTSIKTNPSPATTRNGVRVTNGSRVRPTVSVGVT